MRNIALLGVGAFAVYWFFFRKTTTSPPLVQLPGPVQITPQIVGTQVPYTLPPSGGYAFPSSINITPQIVGVGIQTPNQAAQQNYGFDPSLLDY